IVVLELSLVLNTFLAILFNADPAFSATLSPLSNRYLVADSPLSAIYSPGLIKQKYTPENKVAIIAIIIIPLDNASDVGLELLGLGLGLGLLGL
ncbi:MAG: hypothetical protein RR245_06955, partial [Clostridia bacterium]